MTDLIPYPFQAEIEAAAGIQGLPPALVAAVVSVESAFDPNAYRMEPLFWVRYRLAQHPVYGPLGCERASASYGLCQLMFPVAYELGYRGEPEGLYHPFLNLEYGTRKLRANLDWARGQTPDEALALRSAVAAYNGGKGSNRPTDSPLRNDRYARKVLAAMKPYC